MVRYYLNSATTLFLFCLLLASLLSGCSCYVRIGISNEIVEDSRRPSSSSAASTEKQTEEYEPDIDDDDDYGSKNKLSACASLYVYKDRKCNGEPLYAMSFPTYRHPGSPCCKLD